MTSKEIENKYLEIINRQNHFVGRYLTGFQELDELYVALFGEFGKYAELYGINIDVRKTIENIIHDYDCFFPTKIEKYLYDSEVKISKVDNDYVIFDHCLLEIDQNYIFIHYNDDAVRENIFNKIVVLKEENPSKIFWVSRGKNGFDCTKLDVKSADFNIKSHYNDDLNLEKITDFINSDRAGIEILYGKPGTGKTYLLRWLAQKYPDKKFYYMDKSTFEYINDSSFVAFLLTESVKNSVFILEDCEILLADRVNTGNVLLSTILNLSDGILGDGLHIKFICTFNAQLEKIDKAILRKGRLVYKYEFKELTPEKVQELAKELGKNIPTGKSMLVSDIYNYEEDTNNHEVKRKIGFT